MGIPREDASWGWTTVSVSRLLSSTQRISTPSNTSASKPISPGVMERMSPIKYLLYLVKLPPPKVATKIPKATAALENTPIRVSAAWLLRLRTKLNSRENTSEKITAAQMGMVIPHRQPMAIPVKAE